MSVYILGSARTPVGSFMGGLSKVPAPELGGTAIKEALERAGQKGEGVDEVYMGHVVQAGCGQAPGRQAAIKGGVPHSVPANTINKVCGSGMKTILMAAQSILAGDNKLAVAGGMENMSLAPHLIPNSRTGMKFGSAELKDSMLYDGLWDPYSNRPMGNCAEECVKKYDFSRQAMDEYAIESFKRAQEAMKAGIFQEEIAPVTVKGRKGETVVSEDEGPFKAKFDKIPHLKPAFDKEGRITAANASTINDGAAAVVVGGEEYRDQAKFKIVAYAAQAQDPTWFTTAPIEAIRKNLDKASLKVDDIDVFEINEAFAAVAMAAMEELKLDHKRVNIYGSGISLGHPIGASGTRIVVTLMNAMEQRQSRYGLAAICIGGGEALSLILERV